MSLQPVSQAAGPRGWRGDPHADSVITVSTDQAIIRIQESTLKQTCEEKDGGAGKSRRQPKATQHASPRAVFFSYSLPHHCPDEDSCTGLMKAQAGSAAPPLLPL